MSKVDDYIKQAKSARTILNNCPEPFKFTSSVTNHPEDGSPEICIEEDGSLQLPYTRRCKIAFKDVRRLLAWLKSHYE